MSILAAGLLWRASNAANIEDIVGTAPGACLLFSMAGTVVAAVAVATFDDRGGTGLEAGSGACTATGGGPVLMATLPTGEITQLSSKMPLPAGVGSGGGLQL